MNKISTVYFLCQDNDDDIIIKRIKKGNFLEIQNERSVVDYLFESKVSLNGIGQKWFIKFLIHLNDTTIEYSISVTVCSITAYTYVNKWSCTLNVCYPYVVDCHKCTLIHFESSETYIGD